MLRIHQRSTDAPLWCDASHSGTQTDKESALHIEAVTATMSQMGRRTWGSTFCSQSFLYLEVPHVTSAHNFLWTKQDRLLT